MKKIIGIALSGIFLISGCALKEEDINNAVDQVKGGTAQQQDTDSGSDSGGETSTVGVTPIAGSDIQASVLTDEVLTAEELQERLDLPDSPIASRVIYFELDSAKVNDESLELLEAHGDFIATNGKVNVTLTGHGDERGSREYNIALGDRRAQSVRRILLFQGASTDQLESVSYGEEKPVVFGHDEAAWSKNRRVELLYQVK